MVQGLFKIAGSEVRLPEFWIRGNKQEKVFAVDVYKQLAEGKLLDTDLDRSLRILLLRVFIQGVISFNLNDV